MAKYLRWVCICGFALAVVSLLVFGVVSRNRSVCTEETRGTVVDVIRIEDDSMLYPVVRYTVRGILYTKRSLSGSNPSVYAVGDEVDVFYNPDSPEEYVLGDAYEVRSISAMLTLVGIVVGLVGFISYEDCKQRSQ